VRGASIVRTDTDYAIQALAHLAGEDTHISGPVLAQRCDLPASFTHKIMNKLVRAGLVTSRAGRSGGFELARTPAEIRLSDVVEAIQGPVTVRPCVVEPSMCSKSDHCTVSCRWRELQENIIQFFQETTLADLGAVSG